ncbi:amidohydrolase family protein [Flavobacterium sp.]|uniref:amidohydrolase family protein n=1 Tax=Flavobacterium sp. TaxID=239 RepID=UPI00286BD961|nr:amidohydrolase family protein [Flavobacterium sp.]
MKKSIISILFSLLFSTTLLSQIQYSDETKKYIEYNDAVIVLKNSLLIDGKGGTPKSKQTIIIKNGKIEWLGDDSKANIPNGANTIDLNGKAIMPGLVMLHEHMYISASSKESRYPNLRQLPVSFPKMYLASGATTIRTCGSIEPYSDIRIKKDIDLGLFPGPFMELTAPYIEGKHSYFPQMKENKTPEEAAAFVNYWADQGFTSFKAYIGVDKPTLKAAIDAAHKRKLKITGHLDMVTYEEAAELGIDNLEHGFMVCTDFVDDKKENENPASGKAYESMGTIDVKSESVKRRIQFLIDKKVGVTSSLAVFEGATTMQPKPNEDVLNAMSPDTRDYYLKNFAAIKSAKTPWDYDKAFANNAKMEKMFYDMGGLLTVGTDPTGNGGTLAGYGTWRAIELLVEVDGFTPLEAIKIATLNGATALGFEKTIGTIEIGKSADLLIIDGDPSKNISDIRKVQLVFKSGVAFNSKKLFESVKGKVGFN